MNPDAMFQQMIGIDITTMRLMTAIAGVSTLVLYVYRLHAIIHCMRRDPGDFPSSVDRVVWSGLSGFMPLGIGAFLYHAVPSRSMWTFFYMIPFCGATIPAIYMLMKIWPNTTNFNLDFLGI